jgi:predicted DNA-binding transcriptional regulator YafY
VVKEKKYYTYAEKNYSIKNVPVTQQDLNTLSEAVDVLRQFKGFGYFSQLSEMVTKLEDKLYQEQHHGRSFIQFDHNDQVKGIEHIDGLHKAIIHRQVLSVTYQSFKAREASTMHFYPCLLKEFRNRWFLLGVKKSDKSILNLALDRIQKFEVDLEERYPKGQLIDIKNHYKDAIGVTINIGQKPINVVFSVPRHHAPYVITKPFHSSQKILKESKTEIIFSMKVVHNFELEKELLSMGETLVVYAPSHLRRSLKKRLSNALKRYEEPISWLEEETNVNSKSN